MRQYRRCGYLQTFLSCTWNAFKQTGSILAHCLQPPVCANTRLQDMRPEFVFMYQGVFSYLQTPYSSFSSSESISGSVSYKEWKNQEWKNKEWKNQHQQNADNKPLGLLMFCNYRLMVNTHKLILKRQPWQCRRCCASCTQNMGWSKRQLFIIIAIHEDLLQ